jgi:hypothetical protein
MRIIRNIAFIFCLVAVFSCTKPEDDSPQNIVPASVTDEPFRDFASPEILAPIDDVDRNPIFINDDGDDESGPSGVGKPK